MLFEVKQQVTRTVARIWPALLLEGILYAFGQEIRVAEHGLTLGLIAGLAPPFVVAYRMANGPRFASSALRAGVVFWVATSMFWAIVLVVSGADEKESASLAGEYLFVTSLFLPVVGAVSLLAGGVVSFVRKAKRV